MLYDYVSIDLETTGLNAKEDTILEIGAIRVRNGVETAFFHTLIDPKREIPQHITELTGITSSDIKGKPIFREIQNELLEFLGNDVLLGHSLLFDYSFLKRAFINNGAITKKGKGNFDRQGIDTLKMARQKLDSLESRSLGALCKYYNIPLSAHRALNDACATSLLYQKMAEQFYNEQDDCSYPLIYKVKKEGPITAAQKERLYKLLDKHKIVSKYDIEHLTKNEADRYLDKILAEFGR